MKTLNEFLSEAKAKGLDLSIKTKIAKDIAKDLTEDDDVKELIGMYLENVAGGENATTKDIKDIENMVKKFAK